MELCTHFVLKSHPYFNIGDDGNPAIQDRELSAHEEFDMKEDIEEQRRRAEMV